MVALSSPLCFGSSLMLIAISVTLLLLFPLPTLQVVVSVGQSADSIATTSNCQSNDPAICNLRSALAYCEEHFNSNNDLTCDVVMIPEMLVEFKDTYGSFTDSITSPLEWSISIIGNGATITGNSDSTMTSTSVFELPLMVYNIAGFPYATGTVGDGLIFDTMVPITACSGDLLTFSTCEHYTGHTILYLFDDSGIRVGYSDDYNDDVNDDYNYNYNYDDYDNYCKFGSKIIYEVPSSLTSCQNYSLQYSCYKQTSCSMDIVGTITKAVAPTSFTLKNLSFASLGSDFVNGVVLNIERPLNLIVSNCNMYNLIGSYGGVIYLYYWKGVIQIQDNRFSNIIALSGGVFFSLTTVSNVFFERNLFHNIYTTNGDGGAIYLSNGDLIYIRNNSFEDCHSSRSGGGISVGRELVDSMVMDNYFQNCSAEWYGGGLYFYRSNNTIIDSFASLNCRAGYGGSVFFFFDTSFVQIRNMTAINSYAKYLGGGILIAFNAQNILIDSFTCINCSAHSGGSIYFYYDVSFIEIRNMTAINSYAMDSGGGMHVDYKAQNILIDSFTCINCSAQSGGSISFYYAVSSIQIRNMTAIKSNAMYSGGGIYIEESAQDILIDSFTCIHCSAQWGGSMSLFYAVSSIEIINMTAIDSYAKYLGGGIEIAYNAQNILIDSFTCINCSAQLGGSISFSNDVSSIEIKNMTAINSYAMSSGGGISIEQSARNVLIDSFTCINCSAQLGGSIYFFSDVSSIVIRNIMAENSYAAENGGGLFIQRSSENISIYNFTCFTCSAKHGGSFYFYEDVSFIQIRNSLAINSHAEEYGGGVYFERNASNIVVDHLTCSNCIANYGGGLYFGAHSSHLHINSSIFHQCLAYKTGAAIYFNDGNKMIAIQNSEFTDVYSPNNSVIHFSTDNSQLTLTDLHFENAKYNSIFFITNNQDFIIKNSRFIRSGSINFASKSQYGIIRNCSFSDIATKEDGGDDKALFFFRGNKHITVEDVSISGSPQFSTSPIVHLESDNSYITFLRCNFSNILREKVVLLDQRNTKIMFASSIFINNTVRDDGGGLTLHTGNNFVSLVDEITWKCFKTLSTPHNYESKKPINGSAAVIYSAAYSCSEAMELLLMFDPQSSGCRSDELAIYSDMKKQITYFHSGGALRTISFPGIELPPLIIPSSSFYIELTGSTDKDIVLDEPRYGFDLYVYAVGPEGNSKPTIFENNRAYRSGGALYAFFNNYYLTAINAQFKNNRAICSSGESSCNGGAVSLWSNNGMFNMIQSVFEGQVSQQFGGALSIGSTHFGSKIKNCRFDHNSATEGGGSLFIGSGNGAGTLKDGNEIKMENVLIKSSSSMGMGGGMYLDSTNNLIMSDCNIDGNNAASDGGGIYANYMNDFKLNNVIIQYNRATHQSGGGILLFSKNDMQLTNCTVQGNRAAAVGGGIFFQDESQVQFVDTCSIIGNRALFGAGLALRRSTLWSMLHAHCTFSNNQAQRGSALLITNLDSKSSHNSLTNMTMKDNLALVGGTVYWIFDAAMRSPPPGIDNLVFLNNSIGYGEVATQAIKLTAPSDYNVSVYLRSFDPPIQLHLFDYYGQPETSSNQSSISVSLDMTAKDKYNCSDLTPSMIAGVRDSNAGQSIDNGRAIMNTLQANCYPGGFVTVNFSAILGSQSQSLVNQLLAQEYRGDSLIATTKLKFRDCRAGEFINSGRCILCGNGTYSLVPNPISNTSCIPCLGMIGVASCTESLLVAKEDYWRRSPVNTAFFACPYKGACKGGKETGDDLCSPGYEGPLCSSCSKGYYYTDDSCQECTANAPLTTTQAILLSIGCIIVGVVVLVIWFQCFYVDINRFKQEAIRRAERGEDPPEVSAAQFYFLWVKTKFQAILIKAKIITSTYQIVMVCSEIFDVTMPKSFAAFASSFKILNLNLALVLPIGCTTDYNYMIVLMGTTLTPIIVTVVIFVCYAIEYVLYSLGHDAVKKRSGLEAAQERYLTIFFYLTYLVFPSVSSTIFQIFNCTNVDPYNEDSNPDDYFLSADMTISCNTDYYRNWRAYAIVMIMIYPIGIPALYFTFLYINRKEISTRQDNESEAQTEGGEGGKELISEDATEEQSRRASSPRRSSIVIKAPADSMYFSSSELLIKNDEESDKVTPLLASTSFLWAAYEPKFWYWEVVEAFRRLLLTAVMSVITPGSSSQNVASIIFSVFFIKVYGYFAPYEEDSDDVLAETGQFQVFGTYFAAMIIQNHLIPQQYEDGMGWALIFMNLGVIYFSLRFTLEAFYHDFIALTSENKEEQKSSEDKEASSQALLEKQDDPPLGVPPSDIELSNIYFQVSEPAVEEAEDAENMRKMDGMTYQQGSQYIVPQHFMIPSFRSWKPQDSSNVDDNNIGNDKDDEIL